MSRTIAVADIGGTNARFALAEIGGDAVVSLGPEATFATSDYPSFGDAWRAFLADRPGAQPDSLGLSFAGPVGGARVRLTNNAWTIDPDSLRALGIGQWVIRNDFGAIAHAAATLDDSYFEPLCGPSGPLPRDGVTTIVGPGTGLGAAIVVSRDGGWSVIETEGGHIGFAPVDAVEERVLERLRERFGRVSAERLASGPGLANLHRALGNPDDSGDPALWQRALDDSDGAARESLQRWCAILGSVSGDLALAHGATAVVVAGGLGFRLRHLLPGSAFGERFVAKDPYEDRMRSIPVRMLAHPQPGLLGAAVAFARAYR